MKRHYNPPSKPHPPRRAEIVREEGGCKYVLDEHGKTTCLVTGSPNGTSHPVGTKGTIQYVPGTSYSLDFFTADTDDANSAS